MTLLPLDPDELLTTTRSVRKRLDLDRPVPLDLVKKCLAVALQAPTGGNAQTWHWIVVTDPELRAQIGEFYRRSYNAYRASRGTAGGSAEKQAATARVVTSADWLADHMGEVPILVIACISASEDLPAENQAGLWGSLLPAAWSYQLAARARGLGTAWTTLHLPHEREAAQILGIPYEEVMQAALIPVAYTIGTEFRPGQREPLERTVHWDIW